MTRQNNDRDFELRLLARMPGALMYRDDDFAGPPEPDVIRQTRLLVDSEAFDCVPKTERETLISSVARTALRAEYHFQRFSLLRRRLDEVRALAPGDVFWDDLVTRVHFELQAQAGAARTLLDELVHLIACRHRVELSELTKSERASWEVSKIFNDRSIEKDSSRNLPELHRLRTHADWYDELNTYRNAFFHSAWEHGTGHYTDDDREIAKAPERNALLVPDRGSLKARRKPYSWTWVDGTTVDDVARSIRHGMEDVLRELCELEWDTTTPARGSVPHEDHPTLIVTLPKPSILVTPSGGLIVPFFTERSKAEALGARMFRLPREQRPELVSVPSVVGPDGARAIHFSFAGGQFDKGPSNSVEVLLDPIPRDDAWREVTATSRVTIELDEQFRSDPLKNIELPVLGGPTRLFVWKSRWPVQVR